MIFARRAGHVGGRSQARIAPDAVVASLYPGVRRALAAMARTPRLLVACDYDGTLAPIVADPWSVQPLPEAVTALRSLAGMAETTVAVISGRALRELALMSRLSCGSASRWQPWLRI